MSGTLSVSGLSSGEVHNFGTVALNTPVAHQFTLRNVGTSNLSLGTLSITGAGYGIDPGDDPTKVILPPAGSGSVTVTGLFTSGGPHPGQLTIPSDDPSSPFIIGLSATVPQSSPVGRSFRTRRMARTRGR